MTLTEEGGVPGGHAGVLVDGDEGAGGLHQAAGAWAGRHHQAGPPMVEGPGLEAGPSLIPGLNKDIHII